jgi:Flp pilus assembly protein TadD
MNIRPVANLGGSILVFEGDFDLHLATAQARLNKGWELYAAGQQEGAVQELLKAAELAPSNPGPPFLLGFVLAHAHRTGPARIQLQAALDLAETHHPEYQSFWMYMITAQLARLQ